VLEGEQRRLPKGRLVVAVSKHYTAVIDGTVRHWRPVPQRHALRLRLLGKIMISPAQLQMHLELVGGRFVAAMAVLLAVLSDGGSQHPRVQVC
jgi:hypothetical protein